MMLAVIAVIFALCAIVFFAKPVLRKLDIPKSSASRAKALDKRVWDGLGLPSLFVRPREIAPKKEYFVTFTYMVDNEWTDAEFSVSQKDYESIAVGDEGILKHRYTDFVAFERF
ncbi:MAG: DUF2500 domain-containing protein [Oscillospiraceae bacterium]|jgi:hypothetical protein|nr:DUF2500 domain-containing protein [Oscillospiraceae bacterium]